MTAAGVLAGCASRPAASSAAARAELGSTGKLRAAINYGNPILASAVRTGSRGR